jgi:N-acetylneuraminic acid mutarotase
LNDKRLILILMVKWKERAPLPVPRAGYAAGVWNAKLIIAGGTRWEGEKKIWTDRTDLFDPATNTWSPGPPMPAPRSDCACATIAGKIYTFGGVVAEAVSKDVLAFDGRDWKPAGELPVALMYPAGAVAGEAVYLLGGLSKFGELTSATTGLFRWKPGGSWKPLSPFPGTPRVGAAVTAIGDQLYVFGGIHMAESTRELHNLGDVWRYDTVRDQWSPGPSLPVLRRAWGAVAVNDGALILGGYTDTFASEVFHFNPQTNQFTRVADLPHPLADAKYFRIGRNVYTAGGESGIKIRGAWTFEGLCD